MIPWTVMPLVQGMCECGHHEDTHAEIGKNGMYSCDRSGCDCHGFQHFHNWQPGPLLRIQVDQIDQDRFIHDVISVLLTCGCGETKLWSP